MGQRVKAARLRAGLRQVDVAAKAGVTQSKLSRVERGSLALTSEEAVAVARVCRIALSRLLAPEAA